MKKLLLIILSLVLSFSILNINANAKLTKKNWYSGLMVAKYGIYSLGCDLGYSRPYFPLRGNNWVYSEDRFGFEADMELGDIFKEFYIKMKISVVKGIANKLKAEYDVAPDGTYHYNTLSFVKKMHGCNVNWVVGNGKIYVKSKKGCIIQIKLYTKLTTSKKWKTYSFSIKVKGRP